VTQWPGKNDTAGSDFAIGVSICYASSVSTPTQDATPVWRHSKLDCVVVAKKPKVQVWGGDLKVYGDITGSASSGASGKHYGSWGEYGVFADGDITSFASGSGLSKGSTNTNNQQLTFANTNGKYGHYGLPTLTALGSQFAVTSGPAPSATLDSLNGRYFTNGSLNINKSDIQSGHTIIITAKGTVTIKGDITYKGPGGTDSFTNISQIPQVIIVAPHINISENVTWIDAWLLATDGGDGSINTCSEKGTTDALTSSDCNEPLTINGPVETDHLYLRRTAGSDDESSLDDPAETFNLRADAYLWAYRQADVTGQAETVYTTEVPPRF
jgi:hypothetical protein